MTKPTIYDMFGTGISEGDWVAFGRRDGNTSSMVVYQYVDGQFHPRWRPGEWKWKKDHTGNFSHDESSGHGWPERMNSRPQSSLMMNNSINLSRWSDDNAEAMWRDNHEQMSEVQNT